MARVEEASGHRHGHSQVHGLIFGWSCVQPEVGLSDCYGSFPTQTFSDSVEFPWEIPW